MKTVAKIRSDRAVRGTHAERSASMRQRLIEATITCLCRVGYAATSTQLVMDEAGVSRGAMLHHFPTRVDLMVSVGEYAAEQQDAIVRKMLSEGSGQDLDNFLHVTEAAWEATTRPAALAFLEIMLAARSDPALNERFPAMVRKIEAEQHQRVWELAETIGIKDRATIDEMVRLHRAALRGLALELIFTGNRTGADHAVRLLAWYKRRLTGELLTAEPSSSLF